MKLSRIAAGLTLAASLLGSTAAVAADGQSPWQFRVRAVVVDPNPDATMVLTDGTDIGGDVDISTSVIPELDITYFFTDNISAELVLGVTKHDVDAVGTVVSPTAPIGLGSTWLLPPTLTAQYHFAPGSTINPYIGAGVNYTIFFSEDLPDNSILDNIDYDSSFGPALQAGVDIKMNPDSDWFFNLDVKKVWINTDVTVDATTNLGTVVSADVDIDPWLFGVGVGRRF